MLPAGFSLRPAEQRDSPALIQLIGGLYADYPGAVLLVDEEEPELRTPATAYAPDGGWWAVEQGGVIVASVAIRPSGYRAGWGELRKLYVSRIVQGQGLGVALLRFAEAEMAARGWRDLHLWTDSRFDAAHRLYAREGWHRHALMRMLNDVSHTTEFEFSKRV